MLLILRKGLEKKPTSFGGEIILDISNREVQEMSLRIGWGLAKISIEFNQRPCVCVLWNVERLLIEKNGVG